MASFGTYSHRAVLDSNYSFCRDEPYKKTNYDNLSHCRSRSSLDDIVANDILSLVRNDFDPIEPSKEKRLHGEGRTKSRREWVGEPPTQSSAPNSKSTKNSIREPISSISDVVNDLETSLLLFKMQFAVEASPIVKSPTTMTVDICSNPLLVETNILPPEVVSSVVLDEFCGKEGNAGETCPTESHCYQKCSNIFSDAISSQSHCCKKIVSEHEKLVPYDRSDASTSVANKNENGTDTVQPLSKIVPVARIGSSSPLPNSRKSPHNLTETMGSISENLDVALFGLQRRLKCFRMNDSINTDVSLAHTIDRYPYFYDNNTRYNHNEEVLITQYDLIETPGSIGRTEKNHLHHHPRCDLKFPDNTLTSSPLRFHQKEEVYNGAPNYLSEKTKLLAKTSDSIRPEPTHLIKFSKSPVSLREPLSSRLNCAHKNLAQFFDLRQLKSKSCT
jgi:hypothetical protein